jgi:hypothetical protein
MYANSRLVQFPGFHYQFRVKFEFSSEHYALSNITTKEPLFYNPLTKTYIVGIKLDPILADMQIAFLMRYDREMTLYKTNRLPVPELTGIYDRIISSNVESAYKVIYLRAYEVQYKSPVGTEATIRALERIGTLLER